MSRNEEETIYVEPSLQHAVSETVYGSAIGGAAGALLGAGVGWELRNALRRGRSPLSRLARSHGHAALTIPAAVTGGVVGSFIGGLGSYKELKIEGVPVVTKSAATMSLSRLGKIYKQPGLAARRVVPGAAGLNKTIGKIAEDHMDISMALAVKLAAAGDDVAAGEEELMTVRKTEVTDPDIQRGQKGTARKRRWIGAGIGAAAYGLAGGLGAMHDGVGLKGAVPFAAASGAVGAGFGALLGHLSARDDAKHTQWTRNQARIATKAAAQGDDVAAAEEEMAQPRRTGGRLAGMIVGGQAAGVGGALVGGALGARFGEVVDKARGLKPLKKNKDRAKTAGVQRVKRMMMSFARKLRAGHIEERHGRVISETPLTRSLQRATRNIELKNKARFGQLKYPVGRGQREAAVQMKREFQKVSSADEIAEIEARVGLNLGYDHFYSDIEEVPGRMAAGLQAALDFEGQRASEAIGE